MSAFVAYVWLLTLIGAIWARSYYLCRANLDSCSFVWWLIHGLRYFFVTFFCMLDVKSWMSDLFFSLWCLLCWSQRLLKGFRWPKEVVMALKIDWKFCLLSTHETIFMFKDYSPFGIRKGITVSVQLNVFISMSSLMNCPTRYLPQQQNQNY